MNIKGWILVLAVVLGAGCDGTNTPEADVPKKTEVTLKEYRVIKTPMYNDILVFQDGEFTVYYTYYSIQVNRKTTQTVPIRAVGERDRGR